MGYKKLIREIIPPDWLTVLKQERAITYFVDTAYLSLVVNGHGDNFPRSREQKDMLRRVIIEMMNYTSITTVTWRFGQAPEEAQYWRTLYFKIIK